MVMENNQVVFHRQKSCVWKVPSAALVRSFGRTWLYLAALVRSFEQEREQAVVQKLSVPLPHDPVNLRMSQKVASELVLT